VSALDFARLNRVASPSAEAARFSSRAAIVFDLKKSLLEGRFDVTEIGRDPLIELIRFMDPEKRNEKLNLARSVLRVGYPTYVGLEMAQGFLDFRLDLGGLVSIKNIGLEGIPLTPILGMAQESFMKNISKGDTP
jgi:hypothetical protein